MPKTNLHIKHFSSHFIAINLWVLLTIVLFVSSCKKFIEPNPPKTNLSETDVYNSDATAISVLTGIYHRMSNDNNIFSGLQSIPLISGLAADEFSLSDQIDFTDEKRYHYIDSLFSDPTGSVGTRFWNEFYSYIFHCNSAIENLTATVNLTESVKSQLLGEAKFMRAFCYFYLTNLYGDVPLVLNNDWQQNSLKARNNITDVYQQIVMDLTEAENLLSDQFLNERLELYTNMLAERVRPTKWAAAALLARVYLYNGDWVNAELKSTQVIENSLFALTPLNDAFLKNNGEAIWQLQPMTFGQNTYDGVLFLLPATGPNFHNPAYLSPQLLSAFEEGDQRRFNRTWVDSIQVDATTFFFPYKYKAGFTGDIADVSQLSEYLTVFRIGEQYLVRAETRAQQDNIAGAQNDLNAIRSRAGLPDTDANDKNELLAAVLHERQVELFSEWGHRWLDLKRTGNIDAIMSTVRPMKANGGQWQSYMQLFPVPFSDIQQNSNLTQNQGY